MSTNENEKGELANPPKRGQFKGLLAEHHQEQDEFFFTDKVIVCEGYDDYLLKRFCNDLFPDQLKEQNVSIISVGEKDNISRLVAFFLDLQIKCFVFSDFDYFLRDKSDEVKKYFGVTPHESVESLGEGFFSQKCIFGKLGPREFLNLRGFRSQLKKQNERLFYTGKSSTEFENPVLINFLGRLRANGIGILNAEIEDCSKDPSLLSPKDKLSLEKVVEINAKLGSGQKISDFFEKSEVEPFLRGVFER
jgi:hypothetical protein